MTSRQRLRELKRKRSKQHPVTRRRNPANTFDDNGLLHGPAQAMHEGDVICTWDDERQGMYATGRVQEDGSIGKYEPRTQP